MERFMPARQPLRIGLLWVLLLSAQAAEEADALPTLFDFLGAMAAGEAADDAGTSWVDPLDMAAMDDAPELVEARQPEVSEHAGAEVAE